MVGAPCLRGHPIYLRGLLIMSPVGKGGARLCIRCLSVVLPIALLLRSGLLKSLLLRYGLLAFPPLCL
eukprot:8317936-Karenia_brevis.AAC.1